MEFGHDFASLPKIAVRRNRDKCNRIDNWSNWFNGGLILNSINAQTWSVTLKYQFIEIHIEINLNHLGVVGVETNTVLLLRIENNSQKSEPLLYVPFVRFYRQNMQEKICQRFSVHLKQKHIKNRNALFSQPINLWEKVYLTFAIVDSKGF